MARKGSSKRASESAKIPEKWLRLMALIPGYDPVKTAPAGYYFDSAQADKVVSFFNEMLHHVEGTLAGKPLVLEPWQAGHIGAVFGWKRPDGTRRYREVFQYIPRKNGKTTELAGLCLFMLFCDGEMGAQIYSAAAEREQAALIYRHAKAMILAEPELERRSKIYSSAKCVVFDASNSSYKAISAEADSKHGFNSHFVIVDELHAQPNRDLIDVLVTSTGSRKQPLVWHITTADYDRESICNEKYDYACKVRDGILDDPSFMPIIYEAKSDDDWTSPEIWRKANPNLGISISEDYLERECNRAKESPAYENTFKRLHLNIRTTNDVTWLSMEQWDACGVCSDETELAGRECYAGLDMSTTTDITALSLVFPNDDGSYDVMPYFFVPGENAKKRQDRDRVPYLTWSNQGLVTMTEGDVVDYDAVRKFINELNERFKIAEIAVDRWNSTQLQTQLMGDGLKVVQFGQGFASMSAPTKELEKLVIGGKLRHGSNPVLRWMASNVSIELDAAGNIKPSKRKSTEKIDGIVATIMALGRAMVREDSGSVYETRGFTFV